MRLIIIVSHPEKKCIKSPLSRFPGSSLLTFTPFSIDVSKLEHPFLIRHCSPVIVEIAVSFTVNFVQWRLKLIGPCINQCA